MRALTIGGRYNWKNRPERLVYLGYNWSGNGYWHQFEKVDQPGVVWCEVLDEQLESFEESNVPQPDVDRRTLLVGGGPSVALTLASAMAFMGLDMPPLRGIPQRKVYDPEKLKANAATRTERERWNADVEAKRFAKKGYR